MKQFKKILVPIDVNIDSKEQIKAAIKLAHEYTSEIILMSVVGDIELPDAIRTIVFESITESLQEIKQEFLVNNITVGEPIVVFGNIVESIIQKAHSEHVNLLVIGSKEKKKSDRFKLGVIAEQIIRECEVPVCVIKCNKKTVFSNILCPIDFSEPSKRALTNAIVLAKKFNANLTILSVYEPIESVSQRIKVNLKQENAIRLTKRTIEMETCIKDFDLEELTFKTEIKCGNINRKILNTIKKEHIDLLIMGTNGRTGLSRFFMGSVTEKVIREMPCSFITVKKD